MPFATHSLAGSAANKMYGGNRWTGAMHSGGPQKAHRMLNTSLPRSPHAPLRCLLVSPEFPKNSFWNWSSVCKVRGEKTMGLPLGLLTLAAILPQEWQFQLVDQNTENSGTTISAAPTWFAWAG